MKRWKIDYSVKGHDDEYHVTVKAENITMALALGIQKVSKLKGAVIWSVTLVEDDVF